MTMKIYRRDNLDYEYNYYELNNGNSEDVKMWVKNKYREDILARERHTNIMC